MFYITLRITLRVVPTSLVTRNGQMRSRWIFLVLALATAAVCTRLGLWQLARHSALHGANGIALAARSTGFRPYPDSASLAPQVGIVVLGRYDHEHELVLRGRAHDGAPGVEIATPLRILGRDTALIVVRGFVPSDDAMSVDRTVLHEPGERRVRGVLLPLPTEGVPIVRHGDTTWSRLPGAWIHLHFPYPVADYALWQEKDSGMAGMPIRTGAPEIGDGPHLNYALQWFAFALIFCVGGVVVVRQRRTESGEPADR